MRSPLRRRVALGLFAAALLGMGASSASAQSLDRDFVTGAWGSEDLEPQFVIFFDASSGPSGQNPTGTVVLGLDFGGAPDPTVAGYNVTCLKVSGNRATIGGVLDFNNGPPLIPPNAVYYVEDGVGGAPDRAVIREAGPRRRLRVRIPCRLDTGHCSRAGAATSSSTTRSSLCRRARISARTAAGAIIRSSRTWGSVWRS